MEKFKPKKKAAVKNLSKKPNVSNKKLFIECFLKYESENLNDTEIKRTQKEGLKNISDGEFWYKVCQEYAKKIHCS